MPFIFYRLYRKSLKKYAIPKKAKMKTKIVRPPINEDELIVSLLLLVSSV